VIEGFDVVRKIQQQPDEGQMLTKRVMILGLERIQ
jgi:hypothetical protein